MVGIQVIGLMGTTEDNRVTRPMSTLEHSNDWNDGYYGRHSSGWTDGYHGRRMSDWNDGCHGK